MTRDDIIRMAREAGVYYRAPETTPFNVSPPLSPQQSARRVRRWLKIPTRDGLALLPPTSEQEEKRNE